MMTFKIWGIKAGRPELAEYAIQAHGEEHAKQKANTIPGIWAIELNNGVFLTQEGLTHMQNFVGSGGCSNFDRDQAIVDVRLDLAECTL